MTAITDLSDLINLMTGGGSANPQLLFDNIDNRITSGTAAATIANQWTSLFQYNKVRGGSGAVPTTVAVPDNTTRGGELQTNPGGGRQLWLGGAAAAPDQPGVLMLYDRLLQIGGLSGTSIAAQTVGGSLTRYTNGVGNQIWAEIYTQIGITSRTITASYTNQGGSGATSQAVNIGNTGLREAQRMIPLILADGDTGVEGVTSVTLSATTGTAGNFGINIIHPLLYIPVPFASAGVIRNCIAGLPNLVEVLSNACLCWAWFAQGTTAPRVPKQITLIEK